MPAGVMMLLCSSHRVRRSLIILSTSFPVHDVSDVGLLAGWCSFGLFFFSKGIGTAVFQSFGSCTVFHVMLTSFSSTVMPLIPRYDDQLADFITTNALSGFWLLNLCQESNN